MIISRTPFRVSFFGGGTDYPAWYREHDGSVLVTTIDKYCYISCRYLPPFFEHRYRIVYGKTELVNEFAEIEHPSVRAVFQWKNCRKGLEVHHDGDLPARSGLGTSSTFTVGLINALTALEGRLITSKQLAEQAIHIEQDVIGEHVGSQDQVSAAFGGFNRIDFKSDGGIDVTPVILPGERRHLLERHLMLVFTGFSRDAPEIAKSQIDNFEDRVTELTRMRELVDEAMAVLQSETTPIDEFGKLLDVTWRYKRTLSDKVTNSRIDDIYEAARRAGAIGGKLLGAGGGGFMLLFVRPEHQDNVRAALKSLVHVPFAFDNSGSKIVLYHPNGFGSS